MELPPSRNRWATDCIQEEGRNTDEVIKEDNLALAAKTKKFKKPFPRQKKGKKSQGKFSDMSKIECYTCHKFAHYARDYRQNKKKPKRRFQASAAEAAKEEDEEQKKEKKTKVNKTDEPKREYYLIAALTGSFSACSTSWLVDSGASRHMTSNRGTLTSYRKKKFTTQVELGDDSTYKIEGVGSTSLQLDSGTVLHVDDIIYVPSLKNNLLYVAGLEDKRHRVLFMDKKVFLWEKDTDIDSAVQIGVRDGDLYKTSKVSTHALVHHTVNPCELWHRRFGHLHYTALPGLQKMVIGMPKVSPKHEGTCKGCALVKNTKKSFP